MNRRRILLSYLANSFSWELYSKVYFYNELVPTTINGKNVLNKAKIVKVSGNGVIENQLVKNGNFEDNSNWTVGGGTVSFSNNKATLTIGTGGNIEFYQSIQKQTGHKYFATFKAKTSYSQSLKLNWGATLNTFSLTTSEQVFSVLVNTLSGNNNLNFTNTGLWAGSTIEIRDVQLIDLTLMFGTGNEPTTLTDNRIQNILNRGYIPFNLGKYKESDIGVVSSEPYNLFDEEMSVSGNSLVSDNFTPIRYGGNYTVESTASGRLDIYDENKNYLDYYSIPVGSRSFTNLQAHFVKFMVNTTTYDKTLCFHLTGTRTGYAPHKTFTPITFKAQLGGAINSHNTMEITNSAYVFTRNIGVVDLGDSVESYYYPASQSNKRSEVLFQTTINTSCKNESYSIVANALCNNYSIVKADTTYTYQEKSLSLNKYNNTSSTLMDIYICDSSFVGMTSAQMKTALTGTKLYYELATPQVITIPKKHLGIVDLGSLNYSEYGSTSDYTQYFTNGLDALAKNNGNAYCSLFMLQNTPRVAGTMFIGTGNGKTYFRTRVGEYANATDFKNSMSGTLLFYETENEVPDIENVVDIESGGTISANWFRWKENQLVPNGNFANGTSGWYTANSGTLSASNNKLTFTKTISGALSIYRANSDYPSFVLNHTYFVSAYVKASSNCTLLFTCGNTNTINLTINANTRTLLYGFATPTANNFVYKILDSNSNLLPINSTIEIEDCQLIDLTLGELEDANFINDPRIQEIIRLGYIPTNTTGTYKEVSPVVLPNIDLSIKGK